MNHFGLSESWGEPVGRELESIKLEERGQGDPFRYKVSRLNHRYLLKKISGHRGFGRGKKKTVLKKKF